MEIMEEPPKSLDFIGYKFIAELTNQPCSNSTLIYQNSMVNAMGKSVKFYF